MPLDRAFVDAFELRLDRGRTHHASVQHAGHAEVLHVGERAHHLAGDVDARHRLADDLEVLGVLGRHRLLGIELDGEALAPDQLAIGDALAAAADDAVRHREVFLLDAEAFGRLVDQRRFGRGRGLSDLDAADLDGEAAPGGALFGRQRRVALHHGDARERHVELFGCHLRQRGLYAGAEIDLAGVERDGTVGVDDEIGIDFGERDWLGGRRTLRETPLRGKREADDQCTATLQHVATRRLDVDVHWCLPQTVLGLRA